MNFPAFLHFPLKLLNTLGRQLLESVQFLTVLQNAKISSSLAQQQAFPTAYAVVEFESAVHLQRLIISPTMLRDHRTCSIMEALITLHAALGF